MELCDQYVHELIQLVPEVNDYHQLPEYLNLRSKWTNTLTMDFHKKEMILLRKYKGILNKKKVKSFYDNIFLDDLTIMMKERSYETLDYVPINSMDNFPIDYISGVQGESTYTFSDKQSYLDYIERFKGIPSITMSIIENMRKGIQHKDTLPSLIALDLRDQYNHALGSNYETLRVPTNVQKAVTLSIQTYVIPAIQQLQNFLEREYICACSDQIGLSALSGGSIIYQGLLEEQTMKGYTPIDIHKLGKREVKRIIGLIHKMKRSMKFKGSLKEFYEYTTTAFASKEDVIHHSNILQEKIYDTVYPTYFVRNLLKKDIADIKSISDKQSKLFAFYMPHKTSGTYYMNANNFKLMNKNELLTLTLHETIPGHHLQLMTHNQSKELPLYSKSSASSGYTEGWALYCENFVDLHTDKEMVWKYVYELQRAIRLVVDTGIHAFNWSYDKAFAYMKQYGYQSDELIRNELIRYICIPSQALSYKVGELTILFLRDRYLEKFPGNIKEFHTLLFEIGPCPLDSLVKEFIKKNI